MKQMMIDMMGAMMPYMKIPMWAAIVIAGLGALLFLRRLVFKKDAPFGAIGWVLMVIGLFYLACQGMGMWLGMKPFVTLFANPSEFNFGYKVYFWSLGVISFAVGLAFRLLDELPAPLRFQR